MKDTVRDLAVQRRIEALYTGGAIAWSADGSVLYTSCTNVVKAIKIDKNNESYTIGDNDESLRVTCICLDTVKDHLFVAYNNGLVREFAIPAEEGDPVNVVRTWKSMHTAPILQMKFNKACTLLATGSADQNVKIWDLPAQCCSHTLKGAAVVSALCFGRNERLMVGYIDGAVRMFDLVKGAQTKLLHEWTAHNSQITGIECIPDTRNVVCVSRDQTATILETETKEKLRTLPLFEAMESSALSSAGTLLTVGEEGVLKEWKIDGARLLKQKRVVTDRLDAVVYCAARNSVFVVSSEQNLAMVSLEKMTVERQLVGFHEEVFSVALAGKSEETLVVAANSTQLRVYDRETYDCKMVDGHTESVLCVRAAPWDGEVVGSASKDNSLIVWRLQGGQLRPIAHATGHTNSVSAVCFSHSGKRPFMVSVSFDTTVKLWSLQEVKEGSVHPVDKVEESKKLVSASTMVAHQKDVTCVDVSLTDALCLTGSMDKTVKLWHIDSNKMQLGIAGTLSGHRRGVWDAKFSPSQQRVVTCSGDMTIKLFSLDDKTCLQTMSGHTSAVLKVEFINAGTQIVSGDSGGILKLWTVKTGECESSIEAHGDKIWSLSLSRDESTYVTAGSDGGVAVWRDVSEEKREAADEKRRELVQQEQTLGNLLDQGRYQEALEYALGLSRPFCALKVINHLVEVDELGAAVAKLDERKTQVLLDFSTQWNTNSRTANAAQQVLSAVLHCRRPEWLLKLPNIVNIVQGFVPYTRRHMERLSKARQDVALLNYTWNQMRLN